jgi:hypothetical protein
MEWYLSIGCFVELNIEDRITDRLSVGWHHLIDCAIKIDSEEMITD